MYGIVSQLIELIFPILLLLNAIFQQIDFTPFLLGYVLILNFFIFFIFYLFIYLFIFIWVTVSVLDLIIQFTLCTWMWCFYIFLIYLCYLCENKMMMIL